MADERRWRHKRTGTVYESVEFHDTRPPLATVRTAAGSEYLVRAEALSPLPDAPEPQRKDEP